MKTKISSIIPTLCTGIALSTGYAAHISTAQACTCERTDMTAAYSDAESVFRGQVLFGFEFLTSNLYFVWVQEMYKGCTPTQRALWIQSEQSSAACGVRLANGGRYVIYSTPGEGIFSFAQSTNSCSGTQPFEGLSPNGLEFLNSRTRCCGDECECTGGKEMVQCFVDPCEAATACNDETAVRCEPNYCGGCNAEYFNDRDERVCAGPRGAKTCIDDRGCDESEYCAIDGLCAPDSTCTVNAECAFPGNEYDPSLDCESYPVCDPDNKCRRNCGDEMCVDHTGYDFGLCDMVVGWVFMGDKCTFISSGCGSLMPNTGTPFASKEDCEARCNLVPPPIPRPRPTPPRNDNGPIIDGGVIDQLQDSGELNG